MSVNPTTGNIFVSIKKPAGTYNIKVTGILTDYVTTTSAILTIKITVPAPPPPTPNPPPTPTPSPPLPITPPPTPPPTPTPTPPPPPPPPPPPVNYPPLFSSTLLDVKVPLMSSYPYVFPSMKD
jgi:hypothetical protein